MRSNPLSFAGTVFLLFFAQLLSAQSIGTRSTAVWMSQLCSQSNFYNTSGDASSYLGPASNDFNGQDFGAHTINSGTLLFNGGAIRSFKDPSTSTICSASMHYRVYAVSGTPGSFTTISLPFAEDCNTGSGQFSSGSGCVAGDQIWSSVADNSSAVNLTTFPAGNYILEVYYSVTGSNSSTTACDETVNTENGGSYFKATFSIQDPKIISTNPSTCNGTNGSIRIKGLTAGKSYTVSYDDDGVSIAAAAYTANASGEIIITGLNAGIYSNFLVETGGCYTPLYTGVILSDPLVIPTFKPIAPFCAGTAAPTLPATSLNGISGTWSPAVISNTSSGSYKFTPNPAQCGLPTTLFVTVNPRQTPSFSFGTSLSICAGATVPVLPNSSQNGFSGTWSRATIDNMNSGTYTFTPNPGACANPVTLTVTVNPIIDPVFSFGNSLSYCAGSAVASLPATSTNGITGTWSPAVIDNNSSGTYVFTPNVGQCGNAFNLSVTINPIVAPVFGFGNSLISCKGGTVPALPAISDNGITGSWSPATIDNNSSGTYTFTADAGQCTTGFTLNVTVNDKSDPSFSFGSSLSLCAGESAPTLPTTSTNGFPGTWSPAVIDNTVSGSYTFTPADPDCVNPFSLTVTVNPIINTSFSFGSSLSFCAGASVPSLPASSDNGITGNWSPSAIDNSNSGTYTFTPDPGQCATSFNLTVTIDPIVAPTFSFGSSLTICAGEAVPNLPAISDNGIAGSWNVASVSNSSSASYTFTPDAGQCSLPFTLTVTVNAKANPDFGFPNTLTICSGDAVPSLNNTSINGYSGSWSSLVIDNTASGTYLFTPTDADCVNQFTLTVTVNPIVVPDFAFGNTIILCTGTAAPALPVISANGISGTWSAAAIDNTNSGSYTFTPDPGQCATGFTLNVTVTPIVLPSFSFGNSLTICKGAAVPTLPAIADNGISGTWSPAAIDNTKDGSYTFTPDNNQCSQPFSLQVTANDKSDPNFAIGNSLTICAGESVPTLDNTSSNGFAGTWSPATIDNMNSGTYIFTPADSDCVNSFSYTVTVNPIVAPLFDFGSSLALCEGGTAPALPATANNGIKGSWSPATIDNMTSGTYTFTADAGQCATGFTLIVNVSSNTTPMFSFGTSLTICAGQSVPALPTTSDNAVTGNWSPSSISNTQSGIYTFTPANGQCAQTVTLAVTVNSKVDPVFTINSNLTICANDAVPALSTTSNNGYAGTWTPASIDNTASGTYTFVPADADCVNSFTVTVTVNPIVAASFGFGSNLSICAGAAVPELSKTADNGITGAWNPAAIDNSSSGSYIFTPDAGQCATGFTLIVTVSPVTIPVFSLTDTLNICAGEPVPGLPVISDNGINGYWLPATVNNMESGSYWFKASDPGCFDSVEFVVNVRPIVTPSFSFGNSASICIGGTVPNLALTADNGISGSWSPSIADNTVSGLYTFTPDPNQCANTTSYQLEVNPIPVVAGRADSIVFDGDMIPAFTPTISNNGIANWTNSNSSIGLGASGTGTIPGFTAINRSNDPVTATITIVPQNGGCAGAAQQYRITVKPKSKDVFVPNVFSPNGDGKNDYFLVYGNYIDQVDMHIYNQWGQEIAVIRNKNQGWDGRHKGSPQPVGVYMYVVKVVLDDGTVINKKGSVTLVR